MSGIEQFLSHSVEDYGIDDRACYITHQGDLALGTVVGVAEDAIVFQLDGSGEYVSARSVGKIDDLLRSSIRHWYKLPDLSLIKTGTVLSTVIQISKAESERVYATVTAIIPNQQITIWYHDDNPVTTYHLKADSSAGETLEAKLFNWEVEE